MTSLQKILFALPLALLAACPAPSVPQSAPPAPSSAAVFDPTTNAIPLPNDIALLSVPSTLPPAQQELLRAFQGQGGFPNDQEVPITIQFQTSTAAPEGTVTTTAPDLEFSTINPGTLVAVLQTAQGVGPATLDPIQPSDYVKTGTVGTLTLHNKGRLPWTPGHYIVALRGGPNGIKTTGGQDIVAAPVFFLIAQGQPLNSEAALSLLRAQTGSTEAAQAAAAQLQPIIDAYKNGPFQVIDQVFPHQEAASMTTFAIAPIAGTQVQLDPGRGVVPLPIDLLRDPRPVGSCAECGKLTPVAACTFAQGKLDAQGNCSSSAAAGFAALDGFSTTAFILAQTSDLLLASSITATTVKMFDLTNPAAPVLLDPSTYITEPAEVVESGFSRVIALQPAGATAGDPTSVFRTRPLKDNTDYAVVITNGVQDKTGKGLVPGTVAKILQFSNPVADATGKSQLTGIDDATAFGLEAMRSKLAPVLNSGQVNKGNVAMAFTFHTQTILSTAAQLGALPYSTPAATAVTGPLPPTIPAVTDTFQKYGVDPGVVPNTNINEILETGITTFRLLDDTTGAFNPDPRAAKPLPINLIVATPKPGTVTAACPQGLPAALKCSPLIVFRHGITRGRLDMLLAADTFTAQGFTVVAIDAEKHGDRSFCTPGVTNIPGTDPPVPQCAGGGTCQRTLDVGSQGDGAAPPGMCSTDFTRQPVTPTCPNATTCPNFDGTNGIPAVSSNYLVTANFFRTRDSLRQDIIDQSQLVRAVTAPSVPGGAANPLFDHMALQGFVIDPSKVSLVGQSLGAIQGAADVASNSRISNAVLNVGGGTIVDIFTNSPTFSAQTNVLLKSLKITPGPNAGFLQFLVVSKMILDPADPVNFAAHLTKDTLLNFIVPPGTAPSPQAPKQVLTQAAFCDQVVPNPFNFILDENVQPFPFPPTGAPGNFQLFFRGTPSPATFTSCPSPTSGLPPPAANAVSHSFLLDWSNPTIATQAQTDAAAFAATAAPQPSLRVFP
jgi:hypothetical protein